MDITKRRLMDILPKLEKPERCRYCIYNQEYTSTPCSIYDICECGIDSFLRLGSKSFETCLARAKLLDNTKERKIYEKICR